MREIIFDTETTGLDARIDRIIEIGAIELVNRFPTGRVFHEYINPEGRKIDAEATTVHGITMESLVGKPRFGEIVDRLIEFIDGAKLIAHNATFDMGFINAEFERQGQPLVDPLRVVDSLAIAKRRHPMGPNSLDALCRRYGIDNSRRTKHGALLDAELLAEVYIELAGGRQSSLILEIVQAGRSPNGSSIAIEIGPRPTPLTSRLTDAELEAHTRMVAGLGEKAVWLRMAESASPAGP